MLGDVLIFKNGESFRLPELIVTQKEVTQEESVVTSLVRKRGCAQLGLYFTCFHTSLRFHCARHSAAGMSSISVQPPECLRKPLQVPHRHMFGPGPSNVPRRLLEAGARPVIGHMHPEIFQVNNNYVYVGEQCKYRICV